MVRRSANGMTYFEVLGAGCSCGGAFTVCGTLLGFSVAGGATGGATEGCGVAVALTCGGSAVAFV